MHKAIIAKIDKVQEIQGADNIQIGYALGTQLIISKTVQVGYIGVLFPAELQLSPDYCRENNLYRHADLNKDKAKVSFFEDNRRVRAQPFLRVKSEGFFADLKSLSYTGYDISKFKVGDQFDELNGIKICEKYISEKTKKEINRKEKNKKLATSQAPLFLEHISTEQFKYYVDSIPKGALITCSSKIHGTSQRCIYTEVTKELPFWKRTINKILPIFSDKSWEYLNGTRRVVLFDGENNKVSYHGSEQFRFDIFEKIKPHLTKNLVVYLEVYGFANGAPIMPRHDVTKLKDKAMQKKYGKAITYKYGCLEDQCDFMIYRIGLSTEDGIIDYTPAQVEEWCQKRGFKYPKQVCEPFLYNGDSQMLRELVEELTERPSMLTEDYTDPTAISEGIVIRVDYKNTVPLLYKNKSWAFRVMEGIAKEESVDMEDAS